MVSLRLVVLSTVCVLGVAACGGGGSGGSDSDNDGIADSADNCPLAPNPEQVDSDGDGIGDDCDGCVADGAPVQFCALCAYVANPGQPDRDGDGIPDACDNCPHISNQDQTDGGNPTNDPTTHCRGCGDACDTDDDDVPEDWEGDSVSNEPCTDAGFTGTLTGAQCDDNCPSVSNPNQFDLDADGLGDDCDPDTDGDGVLNDGDNSGSAGDNPCTAGVTSNCDDNCPVVQNASQADINGNGIGDLCEGAIADTDGD
ncbi:MAG: thrombospondin type 3 repeat-containing protein, partial [Deltaproteobacteria bacterium]|nr:thrombospondin type 3 repeat-containing protein [Deltaproteobacteria bacterium]